MTTTSPLSQGSEAVTSPPNLVRKRVVLHFPGFEPLDARLHHDRYQRSAAQSAQTWGLDVTVGELQQQGTARFFDVSCRNADHLTESRVHIFDHDSLVSAFSNKPLPVRILQGYIAGARVIAEGGMTGYFRHAWRFGLFFLSPFLLVAITILAALLTAGMPFLLELENWHYGWSALLAIGLVWALLVTVLRRLHTLHLFADWQMAVAAARLDELHTNRWIEACKADMRAALEEPADEYVISSHSMGSTMATHVFGTLLAEEPGIVSGRRVAFVTLGGAILQCSLLRSASILRAHVGRIARAPEIFWLEIQCMTDSIHFYRSKVVTLAGHPEAPQAKIAFIRVKWLLTTERYKRIKRDFLRVHRQYVLGSDKRSNFDFTLMTAGPLAAESFAAFKPEDLPR